MTAYSAVFLLRVRGDFELPPVTIPLIKSITALAPLVNLVRSA